MTNEISPMHPTVGIESVGRYETERMTLPPKAEARVVGARVENNLQILYHNEKSLVDQARELTVPHIGDNRILVPHHFDVALDDAVNKVKSDGDSPAAATMQSLKETRMQWRENSLALNMA